MNPVTTMAVAFSMSADAFAVAIAKGMQLHRPRLREALRTGLIFGVIEAITPLIGWALGRAASGYVEAIDHWIAFAILGLLGLKMLHDAIWPAAEAQSKPRRHGFITLCLAAVGSSIDALAIGVTLAFIDANIILTALAIGFATFLMVTVGIMAGRWLGKRMGRLAEGFGGVILLAIGSFIVMEHMGVLAAL